MKTHKLVIDGQLPNLNDYTRATRANKYIGAKMKKATEEIITIYIKEHLKGVQLHDRVKLTFKWYEPNKRRDMDNICFAKKFILDALVTNNVIQTDDWRGVQGFTDEFYIDKGYPRVEVLIEEVGDET